MGEVAQRLLVRGALGCVAALFERSFYVSVAGGFVCIGDGTLGDGPLNAVCALPAGTPWRRLGVRVGAATRCTDAELWVSPGLAFDLACARAWRPPAPPSWSAVSLARGLDRLHRLAVGRVPEDGLGGLVLTAGRLRAASPVRRRAAAPAAALGRWLRAAPGESGPACELGRAVDGLLGLGPGLTPSGDDLLGGVMVALETLGQRTAAARLAVRVRGVCGTATTPLAAAHLAAAMQGLAAAPLHDALRALLAGDGEGLAKALRGVAHVGHCSGWDALAGMVLALRAWLDVAPRSTYTGAGRVGVRKLTDVPLACGALSVPLEVNDAST